MNIQPRLKKCPQSNTNVQEITLKHLLLATVGFWAILSNGLDKTEVTNEGNFIE